MADTNFPSGVPGEESADYLGRKAPSTLTAQPGLPVAGPVGTSAAPATTSGGKGLAGVKGEAQMAELRGSIADQLRAMGLEPAGGDTGEGGAGGGAGAGAAPGVGAITGFDAPTFGNFISSLGRGVGLPGTAFNTLDSAIMGMGLKGGSFLAQAINSLFGPSSQLSVVTPTGKDAALPGARVTTGNKALDFVMGLVMPGVFGSLTSVGTSPDLTPEMATALTLALVNPEIPLTPQQAKVLSNLTIRASEIDPLGGVPTQGPHGIGFSMSPSDAANALALAGLAPTVTNIDAVGKLSASQFGALRGNPQGLRAAIQANLRGATAGQPDPPEGAPPAPPTVPDIPENENPQGDQGAPGTPGSGGPAGGGTGEGGGSAAGNSGDASDAE